MNSVFYHFMDDCKSINRFLKYTATKDYISQALISEGAMSRDFSKFSRYNESAVFSFFPG